MENKRKIIVMSINRGNEKTLSGLPRKREGERKGAMKYKFRELLEILGEYYPEGMPDHETYIKSEFYNKYIMGREGQDYTRSGMEEYIK